MSGSYKAYFILDGMSNDSIAVYNAKLINTVKYACINCVDMQSVDVRMSNDLNEKIKKKAARANNTRPLS